MVWHYFSRVLREMSHLSFKLTSSTSHSQSHNSELMTLARKIKHELVTQTCSKQFHIWSRALYNIARSGSNVSWPTIFALSSGGRRCAVGVIRVSGPNSGLAMEKLCGQKTKPRAACVRKLVHPETQEMLDRALVIWFPGPKSFTGEDCAEFHVHGGPAVISSVLSALGSMPGLQPAEPGEFSKRAFMNGKLDLTEVEGIGDLVHAETEAQKKQALRQMEGDLGQLYSHWRTRLIKALANVEAFIDFSEEENIEEDVMLAVCSDIDKIQKELLSHLKDSRQGERLRDGLHVVILGEPNVGKSSLLNALCQRPAAIVSPIAGTTRDIVETALDISGYPILISDTAGLRTTSDEVEKEGVVRALKRAHQADLKILVLDSLSHGKQIGMSSFHNFVTNHIKQLGLDNAQQEEILHTSNYTELTHSENMDSFSRIPSDLSDFLVVMNKSDLAEPLMLKQVKEQTNSSLSFLSCHTGEGMEEFLAVFVDRIKQMCGDPLVHSSSLVQTRHRHHLAQCQLHLSQFERLLSTDVVLAAEQLRRASRELGLITGAISVEDVLDVIFKDFCIGK